MGVNRELARRQVRLGGQGAGSRTGRCGRRGRTVPASSSEWLQATSASLRGARLSSQPEGPAFPPFLLALEEPSWDMSISVDARWGGGTPFPWPRCLARRPLGCLRPRVDSAAVNQAEPVRRETALSQAAHAAFGGVRGGGVCRSYAFQHQACSRCP